ncbi:hypothetical protein RvVAT039_16540 [Agrobacterium vitis]|nr:hypothetical protein RvVAT039_16540 [Agrobacterium vitis]
MRRLALPASGEEDQSVANLLPHPVRCWREANGGHQLTGAESLPIERPDLATRKGAKQTNGRGKNRATG